MKKLILFLCSFLLAITIYADEIPTITVNYAVDSNNVPIESISNTYHTNTSRIEVHYSIDRFDENYCLMEIEYMFNYVNDIDRVQYFNNSHVNCNYSPGESTMYAYPIYDGSDGFTKKYSFVKKSDKLNVDNMFEDDWDRSKEYIKLEKSNEIEMNFTNDAGTALNKIKPSFEEIRDNDGVVINAIEDKYNFDSSKTYYMYFKLNTIDSDVTYKYSIEFDDGEIITNSITRQGQYLIIPLNFEGQTKAINTFYVWFTFSNEYTTHLSNSSNTYYYQLTNTKQLKVDLKYKNYNKAIGKEWNIATFYSKYYNASNPLEIDIDLYKYDAGQYDGVINFYEIDWSDENDTPQKKYSKNIILTQGQTNTIMIDDFVPEYSQLYKEYYFEIEIAGTVFQQYYCYSGGEVRGAAYDYRGRLITNTNYGDGGNNHTLQGYNYSKEYSDNMYIIYGGFELEDNKEYRYEIISGVAADEGGYMEMVSPKTISSGTITGKQLNDNQMLANIKYIKEDKLQIVLFKLYDNNDLIYVYNTEMSLHPDDVSNTYSYLTSSNETVITSYKYKMRRFLIKGTTPLELYLKGTGLDNNKNYNYYISVSDDSLIAFGEILGKDLNDGTIISINIEDVVSKLKNGGAIDIYIFPSDNKELNYNYNTSIEIQYVTQGEYNDNSNYGQFINDSQELLSAANGLSDDTAKWLINENNQQEDPITPDNPTNPGETNTTIPDNPTNPGETNTTPEEPKPVEPKPVEPTPVSTETLQKANINVTKSEENSVIVTIENYYINQRYVLEKSTDNKKWKSIADFSANAIRIYDLKFGQKTYFRVRTELNGTKVNSNTVNITVKPNTVSNIRISSAGSTNIKVAWDKAPYTGYELQRSTKPTSGFKKVTLITKSKTTSYNNKRLKKATTYYYRIRTYKTVSGKKIYSGWSEVVSATTGPNTPKKPSIKATNYETIELNLKGTKTATKYDIQRSTKKNKGYSTVATVTDLKFIDTVNTGTTYYYRVRACNDNNVCSGWTKYVSKKTSLSKPSITLNTTDIGKIELTHNAIAGADGYEIQKSTKSAKKGFKKAGESVELTFTEEGLKSGKKVYYKVRAYRIINGKRINGPWSKVLNKKVQ